MSTTIITFLGAGTPRSTTYLHQGKSYTGLVFAEALRQFCPDYDRMIVCVTDKARENTWSVLEALKDDRIQPLDIPTGINNDEIWETFRIVTEQVEINEEVIFDITHGLRSLPFLVFLFAAYLKSAKNIKIKAVYYGALELGDSRNNIPAPVIDLSEFTSMIDWITATTQFVELGNGQVLAKLIRAELPSNAELRDSIDARLVRDHLKPTAEAIENISLSLSITRPIEAMQSASALESIITRALPTFKQKARPFSLLANRLIDEYGQFGLNQPNDQVSLQENLELQLVMIEWYLNRDNIVQAMTLAREWIVSVLAYKFELPILDRDSGRMPVERALNNYNSSLRSDRPPNLNPSHCDQQFNSLENAQMIAILWSQIAEIRNDIAHVGMNLNPRRANDLKVNSVRLLSDLQSLKDQLLII